MINQSNTFFLMKYLRSRWWSRLPHNVIFCTISHLSRNFPQNLSVWLHFLPLIQVWVAETTVWAGPPGWACLKNLPRETSRRHPDQMPELPQLAPLNAEEQQLYYESLPISKAELSHPVKETYFSCLYWQSHSFGHYPELMTIEWELGHRLTCKLKDLPSGSALSSTKQTASATASLPNSSVNLPLHFILTGKKDHKILDLLQ